MASPSSSTAARILGPDSDEELLIEARMGKMIVVDRLVKPDLRKGMLRLIRGEGFLRLQWRERSQDYPEDDILIFPHEASFEKVQQSSGRVYILNFKHDDRKHFFWMQEPDEKRDSEICGTVDYILNYPFPESDEEEEYNVHDGEGASSQVAETSKMDGDSHSFSDVLVAPQAATSEGAVQMADLQRILSSITPASGALGSGPLLQQDTGPSLIDLLKPELVIPLLDSSLLDENLTQFLPEGSWTPQAIADLLQSPQFHQQVDAFTHVLRSGQIDLSQFGIDSTNYNFTVLSFLEAIEDQVTKRAASNLAVSSSEDIGKDQESDHKMEEGSR